MLLVILMFIVIVNIRGSITTRFIINLDIWPPRRCTLQAVEATEIVLKARCRNLEVKCCINLGVYSATLLDSLEQRFRRFIRGSSAQTFSHNAFERFLCAPPGNQCIRPVTLQAI
ncbi:hypothetical protein AK812_SmicGene43866 [Symbiodinium microadriaticum]|uniref:Secreted protein n=1 Tax=Symbiodinium microadriaticum TaxID=2951 RepID=A0A1Q9BZX4_SYMMI|nr:hypothetical protein AK812_SmicGene43866 [Symbiodinium microadriaticum]